MTEAYAVEPEPGIGKVLVGAHFIDAYRVTVAAVGLDAADAARSMFGQPPGWVGRLMTLRNALVTPFGLKTGRGAGDHRERIGFFPIESATPNRIVLGLEDKHLDFRVVVDVVGKGVVSEVTATTVVRLHNLLGRLYLTAILPFHKMIVRSLLRRVTAR